MTTGKAPRPQHTPETWWNVWTEKTTINSILTIIGIIVTLIGIAVGIYFVLPAQKQDEILRALDSILIYLYVILFYAFILFVLILSSVKYHYIYKKHSNAAKQLGALIPEAETLTHHLEALTDLFLKEKGGRFYSLRKLTKIEENIPNNSKVIIRRPNAIADTNIEPLTSIMIKNADRNVIYTVIVVPNFVAGQDIPIDWINIKNLKTITVDISSSSLVIPSLGLVLYLIPESHVVDDWNILGGKSIWYEKTLNNQPRALSKAYVSGFVLIPTPSSDADLSNDFLAITIDEYDIQELLPRVLK